VSRLGRTWTLASYKIRFFFGPAFRGRFGPLVYVGLIVLFVPSGWGAGLAIGTVLQDAGPARAVAVLSAPLGAILSFGLLYSLGTGVTAHPSEFDFFMTAQIRPREFLAADLIFQVASIVVTGGVAIVVSALALGVSLGRPIPSALGMLAALGAYMIFVLLVSQVFVVLRVRYRRWPIRSAILALIVLALLPAIALGRADFPVRFGDLPAPSSAFAGLGYAVLTGDAPLAGPLGLVLVYLGLAVGAWALVSNAYIFHGVRPTLSAGFGQIDMGAKMDTQRRLIGGLGRVTTRIRLRPERGSETGLMTRLHLVRIWRDGSVIFIILFAAIGIGPAILSTGQSLASTTIGVTQILTFLLAVLAMNWSYYERENLWILVTSGSRTGAYFRGLLASFAAVGVGVALVFLAILGLVASARPPVVDLALPLAAPVAAAVTAAAILTRVKLRPAAFSPMVLGILIAVALGGFLGGLVGQVLLFVALLGGIGEAVQAFVLVAYLAGLGALGLWVVTRLAASFRW